MKFRCSHCDHTFDLNAKDFQRCPNCFWTTSLVALEDASSVSESERQRQEPISQPFSQPSTKTPTPARFRMSVIVIVCVGVAGALFLMRKPIGEKLSDIPVVAMFRTSPIRTLSGATVPKSKTDEEKTLKMSEADRASVIQAFKIQIPRTLTEDEREILRKQVASPTLALDQPEITAWSEDEFESFVEKEQKQRKISLGRGYVRRLKKTFQNHYLPAQEAFQAGHYELSRESFIRSLSFPVYQNDPNKFRAVVLVMFRSYVNDVIGKIAILNQYLLGQDSLTEMQAIFNSYQSLAGYFELQQWDRALEAIEALKARIERFERQPGDEMVRYPSALGEVDLELQNAIRAEAAPKPDAVVSWKAMLIDLGLKEKIAKQNLPNALRESQARFDEAIELLKKGKWGEARSLLRAVEHPPELVTEAKKRLAVINQTATGSE